MAFSRRRAEGGLVSSGARTPGVSPEIVVDLDAHVSGMPCGEVRISQILILVAEDNLWWITAQHNAMQSASH